MNKLFHISLLLTVVFALQSCVSFNTTGLNHLSKAQQEMIAMPTVALDQLEVNDTIYLVNDSIVKEWLADKEFAIVHGYLTWCKGEYCINPAVVVKNLQDTGLPFLMIAGDYESKNGYHANFPFLAIDFDYYNTKNYSKGIEKMYRALGCGEDWWQLYFLFHNGQYVGTAQTLPELMEIYKSASKQVLAAKPSGFRNMEPYVKKGAGSSPSLSRFAPQRTSSSLSRFAPQRTSSSLSRFASQRTSPSL